MPNLIYLNISNNLFTNLNSFVKKEDDEEIFKNLWKLDISNNKVNKVISMDLPNLIHLEINSNDVKKIESFENC